MEPAVASSSQASRVRARSGQSRYDAALALASEVATALGVEEPNEPYEVRLARSLAASLIDQLTELTGLRV